MIYSYPSWPLGTTLPWDDGIRWTTDLSVAPTDRFLDLTYVKEKVLRVLSEGADDEDIENLIDEAVDLFEHETNRALMPQTWVQRMSAFPWGEIKLPRPPVISVTSVQYYDGSGVLQTMDSGTYELVPAGSVSKALLKPIVNASWPSTCARADAVIITTVNGYADQSLVPARFRRGIALVIAELYEVRRLSLQIPGTNAVAPLQTSRFWTKVVD